jgi:hypothetical protein
MGNYWQAHNFQFSNRSVDHNNLPVPSKQSTQHSDPSTLHTKATLRKRPKNIMGEILKIEKSMIAIKRVNQMLIIPSGHLAFGNDRHSGQRCATRIPGVQRHPYQHIQKQSELASTSTPTTEIMGKN